MIEVIGSLEGILVRASGRAIKLQCPGYKSDSRSVGYRPPLETCGRHRGSPVSAAAQHHNWTKYTPSMDIYETWLDLPLIVLAGLR